jgi:PAS domain S-box-containing protein
MPNRIHPEDRIIHDLARIRENLAADNAPNAASEEMELVLDRAVGALRRYRAEADALVQSSRSLLEHRGFAEAARFIFDACKSLIGATAGYVALLSDDGEENEVLFLEAGGLPCSVDPELPMPIRGLRAESYRTGKAVYDNSFSTSKWMQFMPEGHVELKNVLFAPLLNEGKAVGLLGLANKPVDFTDADCEIAESFSEFAAISLVHSWTAQSLEESEERLSSIVGTAGDAVMCIDPSGAIIFWNRAAEEVLGHTSEEILGQSLDCIIPEGFRQAHKEALRKATGNGDSAVSRKRMEVRARRRDGTEIPVELSISSWSTSDGNFFTGIIRDISERKENEVKLRRAHEELEHRVEERTKELREANERLMNEIRARTAAEAELRIAHNELEKRVNERTAELARANEQLKESEERFLQLAANVNEVFWLRNAADNNRFTYVSPAFERVWELSPEEIYRNPDAWLDAVIPEDRPLFEDSLVALTNKGEGYIQEFRIRSRDGSVRWILDQGFAVKDELDRITRIGGVAQDITDRKVEEEHKEMLIEEIKDFAYIVSHDLRAPIINMKGFVTEAQYVLEDIKQDLDQACSRMDSEEAERVKTAFDSDLPESLRFIDSAASRMETLTDALLKLSRLGRRELRPEALDMNRIVRQTLESLAYQISEAEIDVETDPLPEVIADRTAMEQIINNLISNAVKFMSPDRRGNIRISGQKLRNETVLRVADNGRGIEKADLNRIFEIFRRVGPRDIPGEGMGLAYVRTLVRRHGGRIWCDSEPGQGTTFSFTIANTELK